MMHHLSIPARDPLHVAQVLAELFGIGGAQQGRDTRPVATRGLACHRLVARIVRRHRILVENRVLLELMTPELTRAYLQATRFDD